MKNYLKILFLCIPLLLTACGTSRHAAAGKDTQTATAVKTTELMAQLKSQETSEYMTAKMNFNLNYGGQHVSVGGSLKMKRNDVIQLSLVAFGIIEAGRLEFTRDEVLMVDKINKRYVRSKYEDLSFLADAELNFYSLQALFRNELFVPGKTTWQGNEHLLHTQSLGNGNTELSYANQMLNFKFLVEMTNALIRQVQVADAKQNSSTQFAWMYDEEQDWNGRLFPTHHKIMLRGSQAIELDINLRNINSNSNWETRTSVRGNYTQMDAQDLIQRLLQLN